MELRPCILIVQFVSECQGTSEKFRIDNGVRQGCIMSLWLFDVYIDGETKEVKREIGG